MVLHRELESFRSYLEQQEYPRVQMLVMVGGAGLTGFLADVALRRLLGVDSMAWRYGLSVGIAYAGFLGLLRLWLMTQGVRAPLAGTLEAGDSALDAADAFLEGSPAPGHSGGPSLLTRGSGGGPASTGGSASATSGGGGGFGLDLDEGVALALVIAAVVGLAVAVAWLVTQAPAILAELALDGALSAGLYRRLRKVDPPTFLGTALRLTITPFLVVGLLMTAAGWGLQAYAPEARTLRGAYEHWRSR